MKSWQNFGFSFQEVGVSSLDTWLLQQTKLRFWIQHKYGDQIEREVHINLPAECYPIGFLAADWGLLSWNCLNGSKGFLDVLLCEVAKIYDILEQIRQ